MAKGTSRAGGTPIGISKPGAARSKRRDFLDHKLRTVLWGWIGEALNAGESSPWGGGGGTGTGAEWTTGTPSTARPAARVQRR